MTRPAEPRPRPGRLAALLACAALAAAACGPGCARRAPSAGGHSGARAEQARRDAEKAAAAGAKAAVVVAAAYVGERGTAAVSVNTPPAPPVAPAAPKIAASPAAPFAPSMTARPPAPARTADEPVIREKVSSEAPHPTEAEADRDALGQAALLLGKKLAELDPPVRYHPTPAEVQAYLRKDSRSVRPLTPTEREVFAEAGFKDANLKFVEYELVVSSEQVRELRGRERTFLGLKVLAGVAAAALAVAAFALAGGVAATLVLV